MTERIQVGGLQVARVLHEFVENEALPGTGVDSAAFWAGAEQVINDLAPRNRALLAERDEIQGKLDAWHGENPGANYDKAAYKNFLTEIGYLRPELLPISRSPPRTSTTRSPPPPVRSWWCR